MRKHNFFRQRHNEGGQTIVLVAIALVSLLGMAALAIDVVTLYLARSEIQRAADATALVAAKAIADSGFTTLPTSDPHYIDGSAQLLAQTMATAAINAMTASNAPNLVAGAVPGLSVAPVIDLSHQGDARVTVTLVRSQLPTFFSKVWGRGTSTVVATAAAEAYNPSNIASFTPIAPTNLKPWLVANADPINGVQFIDAAGTVEPSVTGEIFNLTPDCTVGNPTCSPLLNNPPKAISASQVQYVPLQVTANSKNVCPACTGASDYEQSIECADVNTYVIPSCGFGTPNAVWDNAVNPSGPSGLSAAGAECLTHASTSGGGKGQDLLIEPGIFFSNPMQIRAQSGPLTGHLVTTSNSIVTIPIIDTNLGAGLFPPTGGNVTVVGYMQAFIKQVDDGTSGTTAGDIQIAVLNIAGCSLTPNGAPPIVGGVGTSPIPVRLITPP